MFIIQWVGQSMFGPFNTADEAISWAERKWNMPWEQMKLSGNWVCYHAEEPT